MKELWSRFVLMLECMTMEEKFISTFGSVFLLGFLMIPAAWHYETKKKNDDNQDKQTK